MEPWQQALEYLGVPFRHRGRTAKGLDCAGLLIRVGLDLGHEVYDIKVYGREPQNDGLYEALRKNAKPKASFQNLEPNDILLMHHRPGQEPNHLALVTPYPNKMGLGIVHAYGEVGKVVWHGLTKKHLRRVDEVFEWPEKG